MNECPIARLLRVPAACWMLLATPLLSAQELLFREVVDPGSNTFVEVTSLFGKLPACGYAPVRVTLSNGSDRARSIDLACRSNDGYFGRSGSEMRSDFSVTAAAGRTEVVDLMVPLATALNGRGGTYLRLDVSMSGDYGSARGSVNSGFQSDHPAVLLSQALFTPNASALDAAFATKSSHRWAGLTFAGQFDPAAMPEDWRAYSGIDVIMITAGEWTSLAPGARTAILAWDRLGGRLIIHAPDNAATFATLGIATDPGTTTDSRATRSFGSVEVRKIPPTLALDPPDTLSLIAARTDNLPPKLESILNDTSSGWPLQNSLGRRGFNYLIFILVLIAFGVIVGPINLFVFAKSGRRHRLFVTTPLISLGASALLVFLIILQDGFGGRGFRSALVEVRADGDEHLAYVHQEQISRTGVLLGSRFEIGESAAIAPLPLAAGHWARITASNGGGGARFLLQPGSPSTAASGDWFQSRSEQGHAITAVSPTRGRIERLDQPGPPQLMSSFDFPLERLYLVGEASDEFWLANDLQPGRTVTCTPANQAEFNATVKAEGDNLTDANSRRLGRVAGRPGHFLAIASAGPFVDTFRSISWNRSHCVITGPVVRP